MIYVKIKLFKQRGNMFDIIKQNILKRYSIEELSEIYGVSLPNREEILQKIKNVNSEKIEASCYDVLNKNSFVKASGEKCYIKVSKEENLLVIEKKMGLLQRLILMLMMFINGILEKINAFIDGLILKIKLKIPANLLNIVLAIFSILSALIFLPFLILKAIINIFVIVRNSMASGGILGLIIGIIVGIFSFFFQLFLILIATLLAPIINKVVDGLILRDCIKKMIIGHFVIDNIIDSKAVVSPNMVTKIDYEIKSTLLGKEKLYIIIKEGEGRVSIMDRIKALIVPTYFVNKQTVIVTDVSNQDKFDNVFKINNK